MNQNLVVLSIFLLSASAGSQLLDPRTRDEDISATQVSVDITEDAEGIKTYSYSVDSSTVNLGTILLLDIDISCENVVDNPPGFDPTTYQTGADIDPTLDGTQVPVVVDAEFGKAGIFGVSADSRVLWSVILAPGDLGSGYRILTPFPPIERRYRLIPSMETSPEWDYSDIDETGGDDPTVPWISDFTVTGMVQAPGCELMEPPEPPPDIFAGTKYPAEPDEVNELLRYSEPLVDAFHLPAGSSGFALTIFYAEDLDPASFAVTPSSQVLIDLFDPVPGAFQTIQMPVDPGKNIFRLEARALAALPTESGSGNETGAGIAVTKDIDNFDVRVDR